MTTPDGVFMVPGLQPASPVTSLVGRLYDKVVTLVPLNEFSRPTTERTSVKLFRVPQEREQNWFPITDYRGGSICPLIEHRLSYRVDRYMVNC